jgi:peroxidase
MMRQTRNSGAECDTGAATAAAFRGDRRVRLNHGRNMRQRISRSGFETLEPRTLFSATQGDPGLFGLPIQSLDGTGNNAVQTTWGSAGEAFLRVSEAAYADGLASPSGADRPNPREVSNALFADPEGGLLNDRNLSAFVYAWGQFLDHDLTLTDSAAPTEALAIPIPTGDPWFDPAGTGAAVLPALRSAYDPGTGSAGPRQQVNALSAFIDGSQIYGIDAERAAALREFSGGRLRTSAGDLLPFNTLGLPNATLGQVPDEALYVAGDIRANENPELLSLHTLFVREHNRLAAETASRHPEWNDEQLFQYVRRIVIAELQDITYHEFLPALLGAGSPAARALAAAGRYGAGIDPGIATEFATAAYRLGHSLLGGDVGFLAADGTPVRDDLALRDAFFNVGVFAETGVEPILKYLASDRAEELDATVVDDVRNFLFGPPGSGGFDLAALNILRGRDHGIADYNAVREAYGLPRVTSFAGITPDTEVQQTLEAVYGSVDRLDLWVAGLAEQHLPGSSLGETFTRIIVEQFTRLRDGDRYWYQRILPRSLARSVERTTLADIVKRNTGLGNLQDDVFFFQTTLSGTVFSDRNGDGRRQRSDAALGQAAVSLMTTDGTLVATTQTDAHGRYRFDGFDLGSYRIEVTAVGGVARSDVVRVTRGGVIDRLDVGVAAAAPVAGKPRRGAPGRPARAAAFATLAADTAAATRPTVAARFAGLSRRGARR